MVLIVIFLVLGLVMGIKKGAVLGGAIGALVLGPVGAALGALVGNAFDDTPTPSTPSPADDWDDLEGPGQSAADIEAREWGYRSFDDYADCHDNDK